jgi:hypothetical protein
MVEANTLRRPATSTASLRPLYQAEILNRDYAAGLATAVKKRFWDLLTQGKYPQVYVLEADSSQR